MVDVLISEFMDESAVESLKSDFSVHYDPELVDRPDELLQLAKSARALIVRNRTQVRGELLSAAADLCVVGRLGVGLDNIDLPACEAAGVQVCPATGANSESVVEYVIGGMLMLLRGAYHSNAQMIAGEWPRTQLSGQEINQRHLGLIGFGGISRLAARKAKALDMKVSAYDPMIPNDAAVWVEEGVEPLSLDDLLAQSDAVSLHVPLVESTQHLINADSIAKMKPGAVLINSARGGVVDDAALAKALTEGALKGAMLDVFEVEPMTADNPFAGVPNLILTPHIAGVTEESNVRVSSVTAANVRRALQEQQ
ncbi:MAG: hydroxyacid dehydrogenase [Halopseudomonas sp.]